MTDVMHVVVAILSRASREVLISKRQAHQYKGGLWEFPGGKVEPDEDIFLALKRECREELGIDVSQAKHWMQFQHDYPERSVLLDVFWVQLFSGEPYGAEGQLVQWVLPENLSDFEFPEGSQRLIDYFTLNSKRIEGEHF